MKIKHKDIELGDHVKDRLTGFEGIVTARTEWLYGCIRVAVLNQELNKDGKVREAEWFDEAQVERIKAVVDPVTKITGGPARETDPGR